MPAAQRAATFQAFMNSAYDNGRGAHSLMRSHYLLDPFPRLLLSLGIRFARVRHFARAHESVARAFVGHWFVGFSQRLHIGDRVGNGLVDASVVTGIKSE